MNIPNIITSQSTNQIQPSEILRTTNFYVASSPDPLGLGPETTYHLDGTTILDQTDIGLYITCNHGNHALVGLIRIHKCYTCTLPSM